MLAQKKITFDERDFFKRPFTRDELGQLLAELKLTPRDIFSTKSPTFREMNVDVESFSAAQLLDLMIDEPRLIRRPLIVIGKQIIIGFDKDELTQSLK